MYGKDNILTIHTSDNHILYFSKISLIHRSPVAKMLNDRNTLIELNLPFESKNLNQFFLYLETNQEIKDLYQFALIADYFALTFDKDYWISKYLNVNHLDKLIYYLNYLTVNKITFHDNIMTEVKPITEKNLLNIEPIVHKKFRNLKLDWVDLIQVLKINNTYPEFVKEYDGIWAKCNELWKTEEQLLKACNTGRDYESLARLTKFYSEKANYMKNYEFS